jgi:sugar lactone lactonase YvrE
MSRNIPELEVECILRSEATVGESPVWHADEQRLYWVDIQGKQVRRFNPRTKEDESFPLPEIVTSIQLRHSGGLIETLAKDFAFLDPDTNSLERISTLEANLETNRFNDGKCDPRGRFWAGTMDAEHWDKPSGSLYRMTADHAVCTMQRNVICSNGTGWSPDRRTMYYTESFRYAVFAYDFDEASGGIDNRRMFARISDDDRKAGGFPDGLTVDAEGGVWSNQVALGRIVRYDPRGKIERTVQLPVPRATSCTFGGEDLRTLFVTSARETMTPDQLRQWPLSGSLFAVDAGVRGLPPTPFAG